MSTLLLKLSSKWIRYRLNIHFISSCLELNLVPKGFTLVNACVLPNDSETRSYLHGIWTATLKLASLHLMRCMCGFYATELPAVQLAIDRLACTDTVHRQIRHQLIALHVTITRKHTKKLNKLGFRFSPKPFVTPSFVASPCLTTMSMDFTAREVEPEVRIQGGMTENTLDPEHENIVVQRDTSIHDEPPDPAKPPVMSDTTVMTGPSRFLVDSFTAALVVEADASLPVVDSSTAALVVEAEASPVLVDSLTAALVVEAEASPVVVDSSITALVVEAEASLIVVDSFTAALVVEAETSPPLLDSSIASRVIYPRLFFFYSPYNCLIGCENRPMTTLGIYYSISRHTED